MFSRTTRTVRLSEAGRALLVEAERTLAGARAARDAVDAVRGLLRGTLTVGVEQCVAGVSPARLLAAFHREHQQMALRLRQEGTSSLLDGVAGGRLDLAFAATAAHAAERKIGCGRRSRRQTRDGAGAPGWCRGAAARPATRHQAGGGAAARSAAPRTSSRGRTAGRGSLRTTAMTARVTRPKGTLM
ncbi:hypothetical protein SBADM41S_08414 [Streptomyces badius]